MSSKKLIRGGDFTFQMTEIINFWSCFCSFKMGPLQISSPVLHDRYFLLNFRVLGEKAFIVDIFRSSCIILRCVFCLVRVDFKLVFL